MEKTFTVVFDGEVFRPAGPVDIEPNTSCEITILSQTRSPTGEEAHEPGPPSSLWSFLEETKGTVEGPEDWSAEHDHYLYGTPKRGDGGGG